MEKYLGSSVLSNLKQKLDSKVNTAYYEQTLESFLSALREYTTDYSEINGVLRTVFKNRIFQVFQGADIRGDGGFTSAFVGQALITQFLRDKQDSATLTTAMTYRVQRADGSYYSGGGTSDWQREADVVGNIISVPDGGTITLQTLANFESDYMCMEQGYWVSPGLTNVDNTYTIYNGSGTHIVAAEPLELTKIGHYRAGSNDYIRGVYKIDKSKCPSGYCTVHFMLITPYNQPADKDNGYFEFFGPNSDIAVTTRMRALTFRVV